MLDRIVTKTKLLAIVDALARSRRIVAPVARGDRYFYDVVKESCQLDLDFNYCVYGPKATLFPPCETLFTFEVGDRSFKTKPVYEDATVALVGVHPCDIHAIRLLDRVFTDDHRDEHYLRRRARTLIVGVDCPQPCTKGVFCRDMKCNEAREGFDLMCYPLHLESNGVEVRYGVVFGTQAGRELFAEHRTGMTPCAADERDFERYLVEKNAAFPKVLPYDVDELPQLFDRSYDSLLWEATARRCYSCGSCNLSCPTCYCFNTYDEVDLTLTSGQRCREWDGCHLRDFADVAGGHNFRPKAASRLRHRMYRKAKWIRERDGLPGCVGCARCDRACTAKINSVEIYHQLAEEVQS